MEQVSSHTHITCGLTKFTLINNNGIVGTLLNAALNEYSNNKAGTHKSIVVLFSVEHFRSQAFIHGYGFVGLVVLYVCTGPRIVPDEQGSTLQGSSAMSTMKWMRGIMKLCVQSAVCLPTKFNENTILYIHTYHTVFSILVYHHCKTKVGSRGSSTASSSCIFCHFRIQGRVICDFWVKE